MEDKPRTDQGQTEDKKDLLRAVTEGKCNFTEISFGFWLNGETCVAKYPIYGFTDKVKEK